MLPSNHPPPFMDPRTNEEVLWLMLLGSSPVPSCGGNY
jgi:hypothetical protein